MAINFSSGQEWTVSVWLHDHYVPANGKYVGFMALNVPDNDYQKMYNKYGCRRAVCDQTTFPALQQAGFSAGNLLIQIGNQAKGLFSDWQNRVNTFKGEVLGYFIDEPTSVVPSSKIQEVKDCIAQYGSQLWIDDYDTGVLWEPIVHKYHLIDTVAVGLGDQIGCDADTTEWLNGMQGLQCALAADYDEFQGWWGNKFTTIWSFPGSRCETDITSWISAHQNINNFFIYLPDGSGWNDIEAFAEEGFAIGFLGSINQLWYDKYICQQNKVAFTPPGPLAEYYGTWNGNVFTGPVDPDYPDATLCWVLGTQVPSGQYSQPFFKS